MEKGDTTLAVVLRDLTTKKSIEEEEDTTGRTTIGEDPNGTTRKVVQSNVTPRKAEE